MDIHDLVEALQLADDDRDQKFEDLSILNRAPDHGRILKGKALRLQLRRPGLKQLLGDENPMLAGGSGDPELDKMLKLRRS